nr:hypothetical protein pmam_77 [Pithovirus mammoth]
MKQCLRNFRLESLKNSKSFLEFEFSINELISGLKGGHP